MVKYPDIQVELTGQDGNGALIIGRVARAIRRAEGDKAADAFVSEATSSESYDALLQLVMQTVAVF